MTEGHEIPGYTNVPTEIRITINTSIDLREPKGKVFLKDGSREIIAPNATDFTVESGVQLQLVDREIRNAKLKESPILSEKVDPRAILRLIRMGIITEK